MLEGDPRRMQASWVRRTTVTVVLQTPEGGGGGGKVVVRMEARGEGGNQGSKVPRLMQMRSQQRNRNAVVVPCRAFPLPTSWYCSVVAYGQQAGQAGVQGTCPHATFSSVSLSLETRPPSLERSRGSRRSGNFATYRQESGPNLT